MACICQNCGEDYKVDLLVPDDLWKRIKPFGKPDGGGLLCGACIMSHVEALGIHGALRAEVVSFEQLTNKDAKP